MAKNPEVSVVCAWFNRSSYISDTIESILSQTFSNFELIVVNDGSTDPQVKEILSRYKDERIRIVHQENTGFTKAIRRAVDMARSPLIAVQGAGDISKPERLEMQVKAFRDDAKIVVCGCMVSNIEVDGTVFGKERLRRVAVKRPSSADLIGTSNPFTHGEVMFRREAYDSVGGYRPIFTYAQDRDLWLRMSQKGDFLVIDRHLYQRRNFLADGVSTNFEKTVIQKRLAALAVQCFHERKATGRDCIDRFQHLAFLLRDPSTIVSHSLARYAVIEAIFGERAQARKIMREANRDKRTSFTMMTMLFLEICRIPFVPATFRAFFKAIGRKPSRLY